MKYAPNFASLDSLLKNHREYNHEFKALLDELDALEKVRPALVEAIEKAEQHEAEVEQARLEAEAKNPYFKDIRSTIVTLDKVDPFTLEQTKNLIKLSKLMEAMTNEKNR